MCGLNFDDLPLRIPSGVVGKTENTVRKYRPRDSVETEKKHQSANVLTLPRSLQLSADSQMNNTPVTSQLESGGSLLRVHPCGVIAYVKGHDHVYSSIENGSRRELQQLTPPYRKA